MIATFASALAHLSWRERTGATPNGERPADVIDRLVNLYRGQIEANYGPVPEPSCAAAE